MSLLLFDKKWSIRFAESAVSLVKQTTSHNVRPDEFSNDYSLIDNNSLSKKLQFRKTARSAFFLQRLPQNLKREIQQFWSILAIFLFLQ